MAVSDRKPDHDDEVLINCVRPASRYTDIGSWSGRDWYDARGGFVEAHVTHWMPLPSPPDSKPFKRNDPMCALSTNVPHWHE